MSDFQSVFWDDLQADLQDPEFRAEFLATLAEVLNT